MPINRFVDELLNLGIIVASFGKSFDTLLTILVIALPDIINNLLEFLQFLVHFVRRSGYFGSSASIISKNLNDNVRGKPSILESCFKRACVLHELISYFARSLSSIPSLLLEVLNIDSSFLKLLREIIPRRGHDSFNKCVSSIRTLLEEPTKKIRYTSEELSCLFEITKYKLPGLSPTRLDGFLKSIEELSRSLYSCSSIICCLSKSLN